MQTHTDVWQTLQGGDRVRKRDGGISSEEGPEAESCSRQIHIQDQPRVRLSRSPGYNSDQSGSPPSWGSVAGEGHGSGEEGGGAEDRLKTKLTLIICSKV